MCLFLTALLRDGRIGLDEYGIEIQQFCVNFLWVVEAADVLPSKSFTDGSYIDKSQTNTDGRDILTKYDIGRSLVNNSFNVKFRTRITGKE
jgi:hypothetical protein